MTPARLLPALLIAATFSSHAELRIPAFTAYLNPDPNGAKVSKENGITNWKDPASHVSWFGELKKTGKMSAVVALKLPKDKISKLQLSVAGQKREALAKGRDGEVNVSFGDYDIAQAGYVRFELSSLNEKQDAGEITALILDGTPTQEAHFNLLPRRNAASVHLFYPTPADAKITAFYNEVTAVEDPVATYYMACGFSRGYFGMQVNSAQERRIIFSIWDAAAGQSAKDRSTVSKENQVELLAKGEGVDAGVFGNEGTGGHSHLIYPWKTGQAQRFVVTAKPDGEHTIYSGFWFHPEKRHWMLIASFRAPKDGKALRGLYSFSENFNGNNGHLQRKALYGNQWIRLEGVQWSELTTASFSHDGTGKVDRLDRFMGVENGQFLLSQGGFVPGFTKYGEKFTRPALGKAPVIELPKITAP